MTGTNKIENSTVTEKNTDDDIEPDIPAPRRDMPDVETIETDDDDVIEIVGKHYTEVIVTTEDVPRNLADMR